MMSPTLSDVEAVPWDDFLRRMRDEWSPGEPGFGRPYWRGQDDVSDGFGPLAPYVLVLDSKGGDRTISKTGWPRITEWPLNREELH